MEEAIFQDYSCGKYVTWVLIPSISSIFTIYNLLPLENTCFDFENIPSIMASESSFNRLPKYSNRYSNV